MFMGGEFNAGTGACGLEALVNPADVAHADEGAPEAIVAAVEAAADPAQVSADKYKILPFGPSSYVAETRGGCPFTPLRGSASLGMVHGASCGPDSFPWYAPAAGRRHSLWVPSLGLGVYPGPPSRDMVVTVGCGAGHLGRREAVDGRI